MDGTTIAAIITGILALLGALATAWTSSWNEQRIQARINKKVLAQYSVPLIIAAWDLANWFFDILEEDNYSPERCAAYGDGWSSQFTSYLLGQYFAGVHIIREMTHFFAHITGADAEMLKKVLWKIQDEFISMHYDGRENLEMRWFEGDILAAQEHLTEVVDHDGAGTAQELRTIRWVEFQKKYAPASEHGNASSPELCKLFERYEDEFQRIVYRRFRTLYTNKWPMQNNPQAFETLRKNLDDVEQRKKLERETLKETLDDENERRRLDKDALKDSLDLEKKRKKLEQEEQSIKDEQQRYPHISVIVPDHRVRRLQHLLSDLVEVLDTFTAMKLNRPVRRCEMKMEHKVSANNNPFRLETGDCIPCDCNSIRCNPKQEDFEDRQLPAKKGKSRLARRKSPSLPRKTHIRQEVTPQERKGVAEQSMA